MKTLIIINISLLTLLIGICMLPGRTFVVEAILSEPEAFREITAYTLRPEETDSTPCETALGPKVDICEWSKKEQLCATRAYPLLTRLKVGDIECIVVDRPAEKYGERIDLVMATREEALNWGIQVKEIIVYR